MNKVLLVVAMFFVLSGCEFSTRHSSAPPAVKTEKKARIEVVGMGGNCLKCGKEFMVSPNEEGIIVLTTTCPDCQRDAKK